MEWVLHIVGLLLWIGGLMAAGLIRGPEQPGHHSTKRRVLMTLALPGLVLTVLLGLGMAFRGGPTLLSGGWFHVKMTLALALIVLHVLVARGKVRGVWMTPVVGLLALSAVTLAHLKPF